MDDEEMQDIVATLAVMVHDAGGEVRLDAQHYAEVLGKHAEEKLGLIFSSTLDVVEGKAELVIELVTNEEATRRFNEQAEANGQDKLPEIEDRDDGTQIIRDADTAKGRGGG